MEERLRTDYAYNLHLLELVETSGVFDMPLIKKEESADFDKLIGFNYVNTNKDLNTGVHFFLDDYQFERIWNKPESYLDKLTGYQGVLTPDFSLYADMPLPLQMYNVYRNRLIGAWWQSKGIKVIPTLSWSDEKSYDFAFEGVEKNAVVAISTVGVVRGKEKTEMFLSGVEEMVKRLAPHEIIIYGKQIDFDCKGAKITSFKNTNTERFEINGR